MSEHSATIRWQRDAGELAGGDYSRRHEWHFDGGAIIAASASPHVVRAPWSDAAAVDPEEAFVASISSCHMLWFLSLAAERGVVVERYEDAAFGTLARIAPQRQAITEVVLRPLVVFGGERRPDDEAIALLHAAAHERCFIANSIRTLIRIEPRI